MQPLAESSRAEHKQGKLRVNKLQIKIWGEVLTAGLNNVFLPHWKRYTANIETPNNLWCQQDSDCLQVTQLLLSLHRKKKNTNRERPHVNAGMTLASPRLCLRQIFTSSPFCCCFVFNPNSRHDSKKSEIQFSRWAGFWTCPYGWGRRVL